MEGIRNARVKATGLFVQVYVHKATGNWINAIDCFTTYTNIELEFIG